MTINGTDVYLWDAKQFTVNIGHAEIENKSEWFERAAMPLFRTPEAKMKPFSITLSVHGTDRDDIMQNCSKIVGACMGDKTELVLDGFEHRFAGALKNATREERGTLNRYHLLTLEFEGYEYQRSVQRYDMTDLLRRDIVVKNPGTLESPMAFKFFTDYATYVSSSTDGVERMPKVNLGIYSVIEVPGDDNVVYQYGIEKALDLNVIDGISGEVYKRTPHGDVDDVEHYGKKEPLEVTGLYKLPTLSPGEKRQVEVSLSERIPAGYTEQMNYTGWFEVEVMALFA